MPPADILIRPPAITLAGRLRLAWRRAALDWAYWRLGRAQLGRRHSVARIRRLQRAKQRAAARL